MKLLFVDDEPAVLAGLRRMLHRSPEGWESDFVRGGSAALERIRAERYDVVVTDMCMDEVGGEQILGVLSREHPGTVRVVLTGYSFRDGAADLAHVVLHKPCQNQVLRQVIDEAVAGTAPGGG